MNDTLLDDTGNLPLNPGRGSARAAQVAGLIPSPVSCLFTTTGPAVTRATFTHHDSSDTSQAAIK